MNRIALFCVAFVSLTIGVAGAAVSSSNEAIILKKDTHDEDIYTVSGEKDKLQSFRDMMEEQWTGGELLPNNSTNKELKFWAYGPRTASQAREFMFSARNFGLGLKIKHYSELDFFVNERNELDKIATKCQFSFDPFFLYPNKNLEIRLHYPVIDRDEFNQKNECLVSELLESENFDEVDFWFSKIRTDIGQSQ